MKITLGFTPCITVDSRLPSDHSLYVFEFLLSKKGLSLIIIHSLCFWANASWWKSNRGRFIWKIGFCDVILWGWCKRLRRPQASFCWNIFIGFGSICSVTIYIWWHINNMCGDPNSGRKMCSSNKLWNIQVHGVIFFYSVYISKGSDVDDKYWWQMSVTDINDKNDGNNYLMQTIFLIEAVNLSWADRRAGICHQY